MSKTDLLLSKLKSIKSKFDINEQKDLDDFFVDESIRNLFNEKLVDKNKIELFCIVKTFNESIYKNKISDFMKHKAIQTRALILDLISTDYTTDIKYIYKPEKWIFKITEDIENTFINLPEFVDLYNKFLLHEFEDIFLNRVQLYGSSGNQLLVNFVFYKNFMSKYLEYDYSGFLIKIKKQIDPIKVFKDFEIEEIVNETYNN